MKISVLASGSKANSYIIHNDNEALIIEAGLPLIDVKKALNFNLTSIVGMIISHAHL